MRLYILALIAVFFIGCAPAVSREAMELVAPEVTFEALARDPDRHVGDYLLLGGAIVSARTDTERGTELEIVQHPLDARGRISATNISAGRFIVQDRTFRDPAIYHPGRLVTIVGRVEGSRVGRIGEFDYLYPVLSAHEVRLWTPADQPGTTRTHFGIGVGIGISR